MAQIFKESFKNFEKKAMNNKWVLIILYSWFLKHILNEIYVLYFQVFPFKPNMILLMLHLFHINCLKIQYFQSNFEH